MILSKYACFFRAQLLLLCVPEFSDRCMFSLYKSKVQSILYLFVPYKYTFVIAKHDIAFRCYFSSEFFISLVLL